MLKTHYFDAVAICCRDDQKVEVEDVFYLKNTLVRGITSKGQEKDPKRKIPTGKLFKLRKFDLDKNE